MVLTCAQVGHALVSVVQEDCQQVTMEEGSAHT